MRILIDQKELERANRFLSQAALEARERSTCSRRRCGAVVVLEDVVIGRGYNSPANKLEGQRRCQCDKSTYHPKVTDKTCCVHAEVRAIHDALRTVGTRSLTKAQLFFTAVDKDNHQLRSGKPYCTLCSKQALDVGIGEWVLAHPEGITVYSAAKYNEISYQYSE